MPLQRQRGLASSLLITSMLVLFMGFGGSWSTAYGQNSGGAPPPADVTGPAGGAEGVPPQRRTAVAGESAEIVEAAPPEAVPETGRNQAVVPASEEILSNALDATGAESAIQWPLVATGVALFALGALFFVRARKTAVQ